MQAGCIICPSKTLMSSPTLLCAVPEDVTALGKAIRTSLRTEPPLITGNRRMSFKTDINTHLGIYARNEWKLSPTSRWMNLT